MGPEIGFVLAIGGFVWCAPNAVRLWRNHGERWNAVPPGWFGSAASWRAYRRQYPAAMVAFFAAVLMFITALLIEVDVLDDAGAYAIFAFMALGLACLLIAVPIALFNRPKRLVPAHLRREPGYLAERRPAPDE